MPQPLASVNFDATLILDTDSGPSKHRPELALLAMEVISQSARLDEARQAVFVELIGGNPKPAASMFAALSGSAARDAALKALANLVLRGDDESDVFAAIDSLYRSASKSRNRIAHWLWGYSPELPDAVVLCDPTDLLGFRIRYKLVAAGNFDPVLSPVPGIPIGRVLGDCALVYKAHDFKQLLREINDVTNFTIMFLIVLKREHPANEDDRQLKMLLTLPQVDTIVSRRRSGRRNAPASTPQSPP